MRLYTSLYLRLAVFFWPATFGIVPADFPNTCGEVVFNCQGASRDSPRRPPDRKTNILYNFFLVKFITIFICFYLFSYTFTPKMFRKIAQ